MKSIVETPYTRGRALRALETSSFCISEVVHQAGIRYPKHGHSHSYLAFALYGEFQEEVAGKTECVTPTGAVLMPGGIIHENWIGRGGHRALLVTLENSFLQLLGRNFQAWRVSHEPHLARAGVGLWRTLQLSLWEGLSGIEENVIQAIDAVSHCRETGREAGPRSVRMAIELLNSRSDGRLTLSGVASSVGVSGCYLSRAFRRTHGRTMSEYLRVVRAKRAAALIAEKLPLAEAAIQAGFADQSHMNRVFVQMYGVTPGQYQHSVSS